MSCQISGTGRIVNEPQLKSAGGSDLLEFRFAMENGFGDKKKTSFFNAVIWGKRASSLVNVLERGTFLCILGAEFHARQYEHNGEKRISPDIIIRDFDFGPRAAAASDDRRAAPSAGASPNNAHRATGGTAVDPDLDDEIPF